jgi:hypothetical protein
MPSESAVKILTLRAAGLWASAIAPRTSTSTPRATPLSTGFRPADRPCTYLENQRDGSRQVLQCRQLRAALPVGARNLRTPLVATRDEASEGGSSPYWLGGAGGPVGAAGTQTQE